MKLKEFSEKNGLVLFYVSIVLLIISVILGFKVCSNNKGFSQRLPMNNRGDMIQNDNRPMNNFNQRNFQNQPIDSNPGINTQTNTEAPTDNPTPVTE